MAYGNGAARRWQWLPAHKIPTISTRITSTSFAPTNPTLAHFTVCHGFNCVEQKHVSLSDDQWRRVAAVFKPRAQMPSAERQQIARAVALVETFVRPQAGICRQASGRIRTCSSGLSCRLT